MTEQEMKYVAQIRHDRLIAQAHRAFAFSNVECWKSFIKNYGLRERSYEEWNRTLYRIGNSLWARAAKIKEDK